MTAARRASFAPHPHRRAMLAKVHLARKELGLAEADYRAVLYRVTRQDSAAALSDAELEAVIGEFKRLGWQQRPRAEFAANGGKSKSVPSSGSEPGRPAGRSVGRPADHPAARKARSLWISLAQLGVVRDSRESALEAFARRQLGVDRLQWADQAQVYKLTEALKAMAERAGWSQQGNPDAAELVKRLIRRMDELLRALEPEAPDLSTRTSGPGIAIGGWDRQSMSFLYGLANELGRELKAARARADGGAAA
ncbi:MAG: regulatory protein GemA [Sandaracinobacter sp.]